MNNALFLEQEPSPDHRFLDILLHETYHPTDLDPLLTRVFASLDNPPEQLPIKVVRPSRRRWVSAVVSLVSVCLLVGLVALWPGESSASELLHEVVNHAEKGGIDREYQIETRGRLKLHAVLWVNGGDRFVLRLRAILPVGEQYVWVGSNGSEFWIVPALGPVLVDRRPEWLLSQLRRQQAALPILHLSAVTRRLESRYNTPRLVDDHPDMKHLTVDQKSPVSELLPHRVEILSHRSIIQKLELFWLEKQPGTESLHMTLTLDKQSTMPADWYEHSAHHPASRRVLPAQENEVP